MKIYQVKDYQEMSLKTAEIIAAQVILKPDSLLGLATGSTPLGAYQLLVKWCQEGLLDFSKVTTINLDEYQGLPETSDQSYVYFMRKHLFDHINIDRNRTFLPDGMEPDREKACRDYNELLKTLGKTDLQLLGLGHNGHIGFNEPGSYFEKETHCVKLSERTRSANRRFFSSEEEVPHYAFTMGIQNIMNAHHILLAVSGEAKAEMVKEAFFGPITPAVPASVLQLHDHFTLVADEAALSKCEKESLAMEE